MNSTNNSPLDQVTLVDEHDNVIGEMDKVKGHRGEAQRHRAISVYLFRKTGEQVNRLTGEQDRELRIEDREIDTKTDQLTTDKPTTELLLQQRSSKKIVGAGMWANTVCGNVRPGESYEECAYRRLREELGIVDVHIEPIYKFEYHLQINQDFSEWEIDQVFVGWYDGQVNPNPDEAQDYMWADWEEIKVESCKVKVESKNFNTKKISLKNNQPQPLAETDQQTNRLTDQLLLAPWFVWMLDDQKLMDKIQIFVER